MTEQYASTRWNLEDLFPSFDAPEVKAALDDLEARFSEFEKYRPVLKPDIPMEVFRRILDQHEANTRKAFRIGQFSSLWFSEDTQNQDAVAFRARVNNLMAELENRILFFSLWWKGLDEDNSERLMSGSGEYTYWLKQLRNFKPYTLSEAEEKIINIKDVNGATALQMLYSSITNRYVYRVEVEGEERELTRGELMSLVYLPDADVRARAYQELYRVYGEDGPILGQIYQALVRDYHNENIDLRKFSGPISVRNLQNDIPDEVVEILLEVSKKNAPLMQRFFRLKASLLGMDRLRRYDIYAPVTSSTKKYLFDDAVKMTLESLGDFDPRVEELARRVIDENHLDSEVRKGKQGGAFCSSGDPDLTPWVLMNYNQSARDISTLAHELGHAIHAMLASHHNVFTFHSSLPLAEAASTFGEMLLIDRLLEEETDEDVRSDILFAQVDDAYGTIMRQIFFALFEKEAHHRIQKGATVDEISEVYMQNLHIQFGDSMEVGEEFCWEWVSIPHIYHTPFYVYAYAFGQLLVFSLYRQYKNEGDPFKPRYLDILSAGGSMPTEEILSRAGFEIRNSEFWQGGYNVLEDMIERLEEIKGL
jgi:oligoendopeptidase F